VSDDGAKKLRVDMHTHSEYSPDSRTPLASQADAIKAAGLHVVCATDHNTIEGALQLARLAPELTIVGEEAKTREGEVIGLFITSRLPPYLRPEEVMDLVHGMGGLTYIPHPFDRRRANFRPERMVELADRIDIIETYNAWCEPAANHAAARFAAELGKVTASGSDAHAASELGRSWMEMDEYSSPEDFLEKLRHARHIVTASSGTGRRA